jgi:Tripartite tricarboxylate transporter TctB family
VAITAVSIAVFEWLGFVITNVLLIAGLLLVIERRSFIPAAVYSVAVVTITYVLFVYALKTPLVTGPFGF